MLAKMLRKRSPGTLLSKNAKQNHYERFLQKLDTGLEYDLTILPVGIHTEGGGFGVVKRCPHFHVH